MQPLLTGCGTFSNLAPQPLILGELGIRIVILRAIAAFWLWYWPLNEPILAQNTVGEEVSALAT